MWDFTKIDLTAFWEERFVEVGFNYRMTDMQAAIGKIQLARLPGFVRRRRSIYHLYNTNLAGIEDRVYMPPENPHAEESNCAFLQYMVVLKEGTHAIRDQMISDARSRGIHLMSGGYFLPVQPVWKTKGLAFREEDFPGARFAADSTLCLPLFTTMTDDEVKEVASCLRSLVDNLIGE
jgi:aminotransferase